jgi:hypothetical protein
MIILIMGIIQMMKNNKIYKIIIKLLNNLMMYPIVMKYKYHKKLKIHKMMQMRII